MRTGWRTWRSNPSCPSGRPAGGCRLGPSRITDWIVPIVRFDAEAMVLGFDSADGAHDVSRPQLGIIQTIDRQPALMRSIGASTVPAFLSTLARVSASRPEFPANSIFL